MPDLSANCVLIVDADAQMRTLLSAHFEKAGFHAIHAGDGIEALVRLRDALPEVIISDLQMPRLSGLKFIGIVRRRFPTNRVSPLLQCVWQLNRFVGVDDGGVRSCPDGTRLLSQPMEEQAPSF